MTAADLENDEVMSAKRRKSTEEADVAISDQELRCMKALHGNQGNLGPSVEHKVLRDSKKSY